MTSGWYLAQIINQIVSIKNSHFELFSIMSKIYHVSFVALFDIFIVTVSADLANNSSLIKTTYKVRGTEDIRSSEYNFFIILFALFERKSIVIGDSISFRFTDLVNSRVHRV